MISLSSFCTHFTMCKKQGELQNGQLHLPCYMFQVNLWCTSCGVRPTFHSFSFFPSSFLHKSTRCCWMLYFQKTLIGITDVEVYPCSTTCSLISKITLQVSFIWQKTICDELVPRKKNWTSSPFPEERKPDHSKAYRQRSDNTIWLNVYTSKQRIQR